MVINASHVFACNHQWVALPGHFICLSCEHVRVELPQDASNRKSLMFFPTSVRAEALELG